MRRALDKETEVTALVLDLKRQSTSHSVAASAKGTSWVGGLFPFVLGMPADTEARACRAVGAEVVATIEAAKRAEEDQ